jgi:hypothetical protein
MYSHRILLFPAFSANAHEKGMQCHVAVKCMSHATWHPRQTRQVMPRVQETYLRHSDMRIVFGVLDIVRFRVAFGKNNRHESRVLWVRWRVTPVRSCKISARLFGIVKRVLNHF